MNNPEIAWLPILIGVLAGLAAIGGGAYVARQFVTQARLGAARLLDDAKQDAENARKEILVTAQEKALALQEAADVRHREMDERDAAIAAAATSAAQSTKGPLRGSRSARTTILNDFERVSASATPPTPMGSISSAHSAAAPPPYPRLRIP